MEPLLAVPPVEYLCFCAAFLITACLRLTIELEKILIAVFSPHGKASITHAMTDDWSVVLKNVSG
jgi:hypothetical protein